MKLFKSFPSTQAMLFAGAIATTFSLSLVAPGSSVRAAWQESPKAVVDQAWQIVNREYVDPSFNSQDWQEVRGDLLRKDYGTREDAYEALRTALKSLEDPYTRFMDQKQYESLTNQTSGELSGVGMRLTQDEKTKILTVSAPIKNSPAMAAGVKAGDQILKINGVPTKGMTVEQAAEKIRGKEGTDISLEFRSEGRKVVRKLTRARIEIPSVEHSVRQEGSERVGYIRLSQFTAHAAQEMQAAIKDLNSQGADAFVLDLRGNPGGLLYAAIDISRMWLEEGEIVQTVDREERDEHIKADNTALTDLPLAILVDKGSASSSEILTGALQDNDRAVVVGSPTFGKALVQSLHPLSDGSGIAVTIAHYYTPKGTDISKKGIMPDFEVDLSKRDQERLANNPDAIGTLEDPQYAKAIDLIREQL